MGQCSCGKREEKHPWVLSTSNYDIDYKVLLVLDNCYYLSIK